MSRGGDLATADVRWLIEATGVSFPEIARRLGWECRRTRRKPRKDGTLGKAFQVTWADAGRVRTLLGFYGQQLIGYEIARALCEAAGVDVAEVGEPRSTTSKVCTRCESEKPLDEFRKEPRGHLGRTSRCSLCIIAENRERRARDRETARRRNRLAQAHRRAALPSGPERRLAEEYIDVLLRDPCSYCGLPAQDIDHIDAIATGGTGHCENLTAACSSCNSRKYTRPLLRALLEIAA